jgi:regulator of sigma E protease
MQILFFIFGIFLFAGLVLVHEFGHFIAARRNGVEVEEFGLGFPPRALSRKTKSGMILSLNWLPLGGFVKLKGEHDADKSKGSFGAASLAAKSRILLAGVTMNALVGILLLTALAVIGMPKLIDKSLDGQDQFIKIINLRPKAEVLASRKTDDPKGYLGVVPNQLEIRRSTWSAPIVAVGFTKQLVVLTFKGLGHALAGLGSIIAGGLTGNKQARQNGQTAASSQVGGPVAIMAVLWGAGTLGIVFILMIIAIISLTLALMNILPLPALDGGRLFVTLTSRAILKRPLSRQAEELVHGTGMAVLLLLVALITIVDVKRFF